MSDDVTTERITVYLSSVHAQKLALLFPTRRRSDFLERMIDSSWRATDEALNALVNNFGYDIATIEHASADTILQIAHKTKIDDVTIETLSHRLKNMKHGDSK